MNEETITQAQSEELTEVPTEAVQETFTEIVTEIVEVELVPTLEPNPTNEMHQLYSILGCNIDHVPANEFEAFTMALQFLAASIFLVMFARACFKLMCSALRGGQ